MIDEILSKIDIYKFLQENGFKKLKRGKEITALCPFHPDRNPSFSINPNTGFFYCHACHEGGNFVQLYMKLKNIVYTQALKELADIAGVEFKQSKEFERQKRLYEIMEFVADFYNKLLLEQRNELAFEILNKKGINEDLIIDWKIGFAPDDDSLIKICIKNGIDLKDLRDIGVIKQVSGTYNDFFRKRIIIPVRDINGRVIGFGGRAIDTQSPKYINSMETILFKKRNTLFGIDKAKKYVRETNNITLLEGYFDVIAMHKVGYRDSVGILGTSFSFDSLGVLRSSIDNVTLMLDADEAGIEAVLKLIPEILARGLNVSLIELVDSKDIDELIAEGYDVSELFSRKLLWDDFVIQHYDSKYGPESFKKILDYFRSVLKNTDEPLKEVYSKRIAEKLKIDKVVFSIPNTPNRTEEVKIDNDMLYIAYYIKSNGRVVDIPHYAFKNPDSYDLYLSLKNGEDVELPNEVKYILSMNEEPNELEKIIKKINREIERMVIRKQIYELKSEIKKNPYSEELYRKLIELKKQEFDLRKILV
ncbi:MAG: DNA primase [bacterium]|nr:DNA primase [bacterium]